MDSSSAHISTPLGIRRNNNVISIREQNSVWREVLHLASHQSISKGSRWMDDGTHTATFSFLDKGMMRLSSLDRNGNERIFLYIGQGCIFNELGVLNNGPNQTPFSSAAIFALEDCEVYHFPQSILQDEAFVLRYPTLMMNLVHSLARKAGAFFSQLDESAGLSPETLVCRYLFRAMEEGMHATRPPFSQTELALALGLHRSTVCRILRQLRDGGILGEFTRHKLEIKDRDALWHLCRPNRD